MVNTGYVLIDASGVDLNTASKTVTGMYEKSKAALDTGKVCYLTNVVDATVKLSNIPVVGYYSSTSATFTFSMNTINISSEDLVTVS